MLATRFAHFILGCQMRQFVKEADGRPKWQWFPPGLYRTVFKAADDQNDNICTLVLQHEIHRQFDADKF
jgi:hypothetical protein